MYFLNNLIQHFVPKHLLDKRDSLEYRKCKFLLWVCLIIILNGLIFLPYYFLFFEFNSLFQAVTISYISVLLVPLFIKKAGQLKTAGIMLCLNTFVVLFTSLLHSEPYPSPNMAWFSLMPIAAAFLVNSNSAWWAALACIISNYSLYKLGLEGIPGPIKNSTIYPVEFNLVRYSMIYLSSALIAKLFVNSWEDMYLQRSRLIDQQVNLNSKLTDARDDALKENRIRALFTASVGHEIKNPLNGILGMIQMLQNTPLDDKQKKYVNIMSKTGDSLVNIIKDILDLTRIEEGKLQIEEIPVHLYALIEEMSENYQVKCEDKQLEYIVEIDPSIPHQVLGDPTRIRQIISNLVDNAVKFTAQGHIRFQASIKAESPRNILLELIVSDSGIGIKHEQLPTLFTPFTQGEVGITKQYGGSGLGLAIVKELLELMHGLIRVESKPGEGTTFIVHIPLRRAPEF